MPSSESAQTVLVVDDEHDVVDLISFNLEQQGFQVIKSYDGNEGLEAAKKHLPDAIILDLMLPGRNGYQVFEGLRKDSRTRAIPVIMLTAKAETSDRIQGLKMGAEDYLTKPFSPKELVLRVRSLLKWSAAAPQINRLRSGPFLIEKSRLQAYLDGEPLNLTGTEFQILLLLLENEGKTVTREDFQAKIWGSEETGSRALDTQMMRLREKLGSQAAAIRSVRGTGYCYFP